MSISARVDAPARIRRATAISLALALVLVSLEWLATPAGAAAGDLDRTFGNDGIVRSIPKFGFATDVIVQSDQRIVIADTAFGVARLLANGEKDTSFGQNGIARAHFHGFGEQLAWDMAPDGQGVVIAGTVEAVHRLPSNFALARFTSTGHLDRTFGHNGKLLVPCVHRPFCGPVGVAVQLDGKIVLAAWMGGFYVVRLNPDGSVDKSLSRDGRIDIRQGQCCPVERTGVRVQPDGDIVAAGGGFLARFGPRGGRDHTFGGDGIVRLPGGNANRLDEVGGLYIAADGTILVAGEETDSWILARYEPDGSLDPTFAGDGSTRVPLLCQDIVDGLAVQRNHRVVVVGGTYNCTENGRFHPAIVRLTPRGVLDSSFGDGGTIITTGTGFASGVAIQHMGSDRIVVAGGPGPYAATGRAPFLAERYRAF